MLNIIKESQEPLNNLVSYSYPLSFQLCFPTKKFILEKNTFIDYKDVSEFFVNLYGTVLPGLSLEFSSLKWMGATVRVPSDVIQFGQWNTSFIVDEKIFNWIYFFEWITWMQNNKDVYTQDYPDYCVDSRLKVFDNWKKTIAIFKIVNIVPENLGELSLSFQDGTGINTSQISFSFDRMELEMRK